MYVCWFAVIFFTPCEFDVAFRVGHRRTKIRGSKIKLFICSKKRFMFRPMCKNLPIKSASSKLVGCDANGFMHQHIGAIFSPISSRNNVNFWWKVPDSMDSKAWLFCVNIKLTCRSKILPLRRQYIYRNTLRCLLYLNTAPESEKLYIAQQNQENLQIFFKIKNT